MHSREVTVSFVSFSVKEPGEVTRVKKKISYIVFEAPDLKFTMYLTLSLFEILDSECFISKEMEQDKSQLTVH